MKAPQSGSKYPKLAKEFKAHRQLADGTFEKVDFKDVKIGEKVMLRNHTGRPMMFHLAKRSIGPGPHKTTGPLRKLDEQQRKMPESVAKKFAASRPKTSNSPIPRKA